MSRSRRITCLGRALGLAFGVIAAFILIELAGRLVMGFDPLPGWAQDFNSRVGYELRPHQHYLYVSQSGEFENEVINNARGLHDVEHTLTKPDGVFRILILAVRRAKCFWRLILRGSLNRC